MNDEYVSSEDPRNARNAVEGRLLANWPPLVCPARRVSHYHSCLPAFCNREQPAAAHVAALQQADPSADTLESFARLAGSSPNRKSSGPYALSNQPTALFNPHSSIINHNPQSAIIYSPSPFVPPQSPKIVEACLPASRRPT
jgi:hypothetical protein